MKHRAHTATALATAIVLVVGLADCRDDSADELPVAPLSPVDETDPTPTPLEEWTNLRPTPDEEWSDLEPTPDEEWSDLGGNVEQDPADADIPLVVPDETDPVTEDPELNLPYEPYDPGPAPGTESCLYAGDPLCDHTIDLPAPDLSSW